MRKIILYFLLTAFVFAASIDTKMYEGDQVPQYLDEIEKTLQNSVTQKIKDQPQIALEHSTLQKLIEIYNVRNEIKPFDTSEFDLTSVITPKNYLHALYQLQTLQSELKRLHSKKEEFQQTLFGLKNTIENTPKSDPEQSILYHNLQYAFYKISIEKIDKTLEIYQTLFEKSFAHFQTAIENVDFRKQSADRIIEHVDKEIDTIEQKDKLLQIDKDSEALQHPPAQEVIANEEEALKNQKDSSLRKKIDAQIMLALESLQSKEQDTFVKIIDTLKEDIKALSDENRSRCFTLQEILITFSENRFDSTSVALASSQALIETYTQRANDLLDKTLFVYEEKAFSIRTLLTFAIILFIGFSIAKIYKNLVARFRRKNRIKSLSTARMIANSGYYMIIIATFFIALRSIGLDLHTIMLVIGAILLWLALGMQGFITNYTMGVLLKIDRSIRIGDQIELDGVIGCVDDMDFRSITLLTGDNTRHVFPNSRFISGAFINHALESEHKRLHIPFSAPKHVCFETLSQTIMNDLKESDLVYVPLDQRASQVIIKDINRHIIRCELLIWVHQHSNYDLDLERSAFFRLVHQSLKKVVL